MSGEKWPYSSILSITLFKITQQSFNQISYWDYETEDTDEDNLDDTIVIDFDPNTECDCEMDVLVYVDVYQNSSGNFVDYENEGFTINGTDEVYFEMANSLSGIKTTVSLVTPNSSTISSNAPSKASISFEE